MVCAHICRGRGAYRHCVCFSIMFMSCVATNKPASRGHREVWWRTTCVRCTRLTHERKQAEKKQVEKSFPFLCLDFPFLDLNLRLCSSKLPFTYMCCTYARTYFVGWRRATKTTQITCTRITITSNFSLGR